MDTGTSEKNAKKLNVREMEKASGGKDEKKNRYEELKRLSRLLRNV